MSKIIMSDFLHSKMQKEAHSQGITTSELVSKLCIEYIMINKLMEGWQDEPKKTLRKVHGRLLSKRNMPVLAETDC